MPIQAIPAYKPPNQHSQPLLLPRQPSQQQASSQATEIKSNFNTFVTATQLSTAASSTRSMSSSRMQKSDQTSSGSHLSRVDTPAASVSSGRSSGSSSSANTEHQLQATSPTSLNQLPPSRSGSHKSSMPIPQASAMYPFSFGVNNSTIPTTNIMFIPGQNTITAVTLAAGGNTGPSPYSDQSAALHNYPTGYPMMTTYPSAKHYGHHTMLGGTYPPQQNTTLLSHQNPALNQRNSGSSSSANNTVVIQNPMAVTAASSQNIYMGYGYYQPAGPLLHPLGAGTNPFHILQQPHVKGFFPASATTIDAKKALPPQPHVMTAASQDVKVKHQSHLDNTGMYTSIKPANYASQAATAEVKKQSPLKKGIGKTTHGSNTTENRSETKKHKVDVIDLSKDGCPTVSSAITSSHVKISTVSNVSKKTDMIRNIIGTGSNGQDVSSPAKQTKDILDLDSKKVKVHRGAVGESDRNSPLKLSKSSKRNNRGNTANSPGFPVQTYKFEAKSNSNDMAQSVMNFVNGTTAVGLINTSKGLEANFDQQTGKVIESNPSLAHNTRVAETKTVASNVSIPFYSNPLSAKVPHHERAMENYCNVRSSFSQQHHVAIPEQREKSVNAKKKPTTPHNSKSSNNLTKTMEGAGSTMRIISTTAGGLVKPIMPVLPIPSVPIQQGLDRPDLALPSSYSGYAKQQQEEVSYGIHSGLSYIATSSGYKPVTTVGYSAGDTTANVAATHGKKNNKNSADHTLSNPSPPNNGQEGSANSALDQTKRTPKKSGKTDGKGVKKDSKTSKSPARPDTLTIKPHTHQKPSPVRSPRQKASKSMESPKQAKHLDSPKQKKSGENVKQKKAEKPKHKTMASPKHSQIMNFPHKYKSITQSSPKQSKSDNSKSKAESPRQKSHDQLKIRLDFTSPKSKIDASSGKLKKDDRVQVGLDDALPPVGKDKSSPGSPRKKLQPSTASQSGWKWEGQSEIKSISTQGEPPAMRKCYTAVRHTDGDIVALRDCVLVKSGPRKKDLPFVAKIAAFWERSPNGEMMMSVLWYYRPEQAEMERLPRREKCEIFASRHRDVVPVACIDDKAYVLTFNEYCRFKSEQRRRAENGCRRAAIMPVRPVSEVSSSLPALPPLHAPAEAVFLCRRVYDVKLKRILKNPQAMYMYPSPSSSKSQTPTPSSKSPSPKSVSPDAGSVKQQPDAVVDLSLSDPSIDIMQAIANTLVGQGVDLPITWGLAGTSSFEFGLAGGAGIASAAQSYVLPPTSTQPQRTQETLYETSDVDLCTPDCKESTMDFGNAFNVSEEQNHEKEQCQNSHIEDKPNLPQDKKPFTSNITGLEVKTQVKLGDESSLSDKQSANNSEGEKVQVSTKSEAVAINILSSRHTEEKQLSEQKDGHIVNNESEVATTNNKNAVSTSSGEKEVNEQPADLVKPTVQSEDLDEDDDQLVMDLDAPQSDSDTEVNAKILEDIKKDVAETELSMSEEKQTFSVAAVSTETCLLEPLTEVSSSSKNIAKISSDADKNSSKTVEEAKRDGCSESPASKQEKESTNNDLDQCAADTKSALMSQKSCQNLATATVEPGLPDTDVQQVKADSVVATTASSALTDHQNVGEEAINLLSQISDSLSEKESNNKDMAIMKITSSSQNKALPLDNQSDTVEISPEKCSLPPVVINNEASVDSIHSDMASESSTEVSRDAIILEDDLKVAAADKTGAKDDVPPQLSFGLSADMTLNICGNITLDEENKRNDNLETPELALNTPELLVNHSVQVDNISTTLLLPSLATTTATSSCAVSNPSRVQDQSATAISSDEVVSSSYVLDIDKQFNADSHGDKAGSDFEVSTASSTLIVNTSSVPASVVHTSPITSEAHKYSAQAPASPILTSPGSAPPNLRSPTAEGCGKIEQIVSRIKMTGSFAAVSSSTKSAGDEQNEEVSSELAATPKK